MRLGVITTSYPRHEGDFAGAFVEDSVQELLSQGHSVDVVAAGDGGGEMSVESRTLGPGPPVMEATEAMAMPTAMARAAPGPRPPTTGRLRISRVESPRGRGDTSLFYGQGAPEALETGSASTWLAAAAFCAGLAEGIRARFGSWDEIHAHWLVPSALVARNLVGASALAVRAHAHSGDVALLERIPAGRTLARWLAGQLTEIVFASDDLRRRFTRLVGASVAAQCRVAPAARARSGLLFAGQATVSEPRRASSGGEQRARTILSVGRLVPIKGFDLLLKAAALHRARAPSEAASGGPRLVILGDGPERARLANLATRLNLDLRLPGFVHRDEVAHWLTAADLYVQPSRRLPNGRTEGLPVATLEALEHGLSVIASDCGGLAELPACHPAARLFPEGDYHALARLLAPAAP
jgi:hypothetical protein